ncbi:MAG TPA: DUF5777 family beta-barrel protein [Vicinamibacterales bacterium]|nr:DUF5777 family beta-barrel protein [Vicinamibacterales bacterium]
MPVRLAAARLAAVICVCAGTAGAAQAPDVQPPPPPSSTPSQAVVEIDQTLITLPTTMSLKRHHGYFHLTHRFARDLRRGDFGDLASDLFSLDNGAIIGLEYRYAVTDRLQAGVHRSILGKTIVTFGRWDLLRQSDSGWLGISAGASVEGQNNLRQDHQPGVSTTFSHVHGTWLALYASPTYIHNAHTLTLRLEHEGHVHDVPGADDAADHSSAIDTVYVGLGTRVRVRETVSAVAEVAPRIGGYKPARADWNAGIEKLTRGHVLQLNFGNNFNTTPGQIARGGSTNEVYMGFNLSRKF